MYNAHSIDTTQHACLHVAHRERCSHFSFNRITVDFEKEVSTIFAGARKAVNRVVRF
ncbi:hypothetical protein PAMC26577_20820 [Caballeronia sordidicola]|uniref:Uncharacterized protein n=1 Tax=Caballeronia sordidicola TaxID=196367 RepID=A0A242MMK7_CABSO|nr:hypothetical protein PAMC26577_20820 [Caballeronia sordidicola]